MVSVKKENGMSYFPKQTRLNLYSLWGILFCSVFTSASYGQVLGTTNFEGLANNTIFTRALFRNQGFTIPWTNGFDQDRAHIDHSQARSGTASLRISFPANSFGPSNNGAQAPLTTTPADELFASYWVRFGENFDWGGSSEGGKLPGLAGGGRCSGCATCTGTNGFSARLMWRTGGRAVLYLYHMDKTGNCGEDIPLRVIIDQNFHFQKGQWHHVAQRVKINTANNSNGEVEVWMDGQPALLRTGLRFVSNTDKVDNLFFSTFHGGNSIDWAPSETVHAWFDDIVIGSRYSDVAMENPTSLNCPRNFKTSQQNSPRLYMDFSKGVTVKAPNGQTFSLKGKSLE